MMDVENRRLKEELSTAKKEAVRWSNKYHDLWYDVKPYLDALHRAPELVRGFLEKILAPKAGAHHECVSSQREYETASVGSRIWNFDFRRIPFEQKRRCVLPVYKQIRLKQAFDDPDEKQSRKIYGVRWKTTTRSITISRFPILKL